MWHSSYSMTISNMAGTETHKETELKKLNTGIKSSTYTWQIVIWKKKNVVCTVLPAVLSLTAINNTAHSSYQHLSPYEQTAFKHCHMLFHM
jgi:hypothetical protein